MQPWVDIRFDCLPLRTVSRLDAPMDASPNLQKLYENVKAAIAKHGRHNTYYLYNARCGFHLTNSAEIGLVEFSFEGVVLTDTTDAKTLTCDLQVYLVRENCDWLSQRRPRRGRCEWSLTAISTRGIWRKLKRVP
jgi:hypothetical protein